jgi:hypothetical protein
MTNLNPPKSPFFKGGLEVLAVVKEALNFHLNIVFQQPST